MPEFFRTPSWPLVVLTASLAFMVGIAGATVIWMTVDDRDGSRAPAAYYESADLAGVTVTDTPIASPPPSAPPVVPVAADFTLDVKIVSKQCFGSSGC